MNNHDPTYVVSTFEGLGYRFSAGLSSALRKGAGLQLDDAHNATEERYFWFHRTSVAVFERIAPLNSPGCTPCQMKRPP